MAAKTERGRAAKRSARLASAFELEVNGVILAAGHWPSCAQTNSWLRMQAVWPSSSLAVRRPTGRAATKARARLIPSNSYLILFLSSAKCAACKWACKCASDAQPLHKSEQVARVQPNLVSSIWISLLACFSLSLSPPYHFSACAGTGERRANSRAQEQASERASGAAARSIVGLSPAAAASSLPLFTQLPCSPAPSPAWPVAVAASSPFRR